MSTRKGAYARRLLREALEKEPSSLYREVERNMAETFTRSVPGAPADIDPRTYLEHRSKVGAYFNTVQWLWIIAGIHSALIRGKV